MTSPSAAPDPDALDALISETRNSWYQRGCAVGRFVLSLEPGEYRSRLVAYMANLEIGHAVIQRAVEQTTSVRLRQDAIRRHRFGLCSCEDEARK